MMASVRTTDQHAAWHWHQRTTDRVGHGGDEMRIGGCPLRQCARAEAERQRTMRLAAGDLEAAEAGAVLRGEGLRYTTLVQHHDREWLHLLVGAVLECGGDDGLCLDEGELGHGEYPAVRMQYFSAQFAPIVGRGR